MSRRQLDETLVQQAVVERSDPSLRHQRLPRVLHDSPAAVLLMDLESGQVVQANPAGRELTAAALALPVDIEQWSRDAELRTPEDAPVLPGQDAVGRIARGEPVHGEPVLVNGRLRWVTGFPVPSADQRQALVVFFDLDTSGPDVEVRERAVVAAGLSFTISDPRLPDNPLVFVNPAFERTTGWSREEVEGRNCRFLQGPGTDPAAVERVREALRTEQHATITLLNHRKDGTAFWNELSLSPVYDAAGELTHYVGIQADVTGRSQVELEREQHLAAERAARAEAEKAQGRLALLAEATSRLASTLDVDTCLEHLTTLIVPEFADWCTVHLLDEQGDVAQVVARHRDPSRQDLLARLEELQPTGLSAASRTSHVLRGGPAVLLAHVDDGDLRRGIDDAELLEVYRQVGLRSVIVVPLLARHQVLGALAVYADGSGRTFDEEDLALAADLARRAALTVDNARLYQREHDVAEQLQRSLLPRLPVVAGLDHAAEYRPGSTAAQVGGDWYDLFALPDGVVGMAIGDVMGHDLAAAASMGQLRSVLQSYAWQGSSPSVVLDRLDQLVQGLDMAQLATCAYGRITLPADGQPGSVRIANAGHLPPVLRSPDGGVRLIGGAPSLLVGAALGTVRDEVEEPLEPGSVLVLCTDGLVEHRGRHLQEGLDALEAAVASGPGGDAGAMVQHLLDRLTSGALDDDVALLVVRVL